MKVSISLLHKQLKHGIVKFRALCFYVLSVSAGIAGECKIGKKCKIGKMEENYSGWRIFIIFASD